MALPLETEARTKVSMTEVYPLTLECITSASKASGMPLAALLGILATEGGRMGEALSNTNGTWDMGAFQINTCHITTLANMGMTAHSVLTDGRVNAHVAAWLLRKEYMRTGDIWQAIGAYHSRTPAKAYAYVVKVQKHLHMLQKQGLSILPFVHKEYDHESQ